MSDETPMPMVALPSRAPLAASWEGYAVFRETYLLYWTDLRHNDAFRSMGSALYDVVLEASGSALLPKLPPPATRYELAAVLADLRHLEGFLAMVGEDRHDRRTEPERARLGSLARRTGRRVRKLADDLQSALGPEPEA